MKRLNKVQQFILESLNSNLPDSIKNKLSESQAHLTALDQRSRLRIAIIGEYNSGKSTFLNKILGEDIMATGNMPCTPVPIEICYGENPTLNIYIENDKMVKEEIRPWVDLKKFSHSGWEIPNLIKIRILVPSPFLKENNIEIIDTPGSNAASLDVHAKLAKEALKNVNACLFLVYCKQAASKSCIEYIKAVQDMGLGVGVLYTKLDVMDSDERTQVLAEYPSHLKQYIPNGIDRIEFGSSIHDDDFDKNILGVKSMRKMISMLIRGAWAKRLDELIFEETSKVIHEIGKCLNNEKITIKKNEKFDSNLKEIFNLLEKSIISSKSGSEKINNLLKIVDLNLSNMRNYYSDTSDVQMHQGVIYGFQDLDNSLSQLATESFQEFTDECLDENFEKICVLSLDSEFDGNWIILTIRDILHKCSYEIHTFAVPFEIHQSFTTAGFPNIPLWRQNISLELDQRLKTFRDVIFEGVLDILQILNSAIDDYKKNLKKEFQEQLKKNYEEKQLIKSQIEALSSFHLEMTKLLKVDIMESAKKEIGQGDKGKVRDHSFLEKLGVKLNIPSKLNNSNPMIYSDVVSNISSDNLNFLVEFERKHFFFTMKKNTGPFNLHISRQIAGAEGSLISKFFDIPTVVLGISSSSISSFKDNSNSGHMLIEICDENKIIVSDLGSTNGSTIVKYNYIDFEEIINNLKLKSNEVSLVDIIKLDKSKRVKNRLLAQKSVIEYIPSLLLLGNECSVLIF